MKRTRLGRWDSDAYEWAKNLAREVSLIEKRNIGVAELTRRWKKDEIKERTLIGAENNRRFGFGKWK